MAIKFGRKRDLHAARVDIVDGVVRVFTKCGIPLQDTEHQVVSDTETCTDCIERKYDE